MRLALVAVTLASLTSGASAGTYLGLGVGSETSGEYERTDTHGTGDLAGYGRSGRLIVGRSFGKLSIEGQASRFDLTQSSWQLEATQLAAALKLSLPMGSGFEFFAKGGLERTWLNGSDPGVLDAAGNGLLLGAGFEYRLDLGFLAGASIFVDYQRASSGFTQDQTMVEFDGVTSMWTLGATVSL